VHGGVDYSLWFEAELIFSMSAEVSWTVIIVRPQTCSARKVGTGGNLDSCSPNVKSHPGNRGRGADYFASD
jgi:hypothetical protein